MMLTMRAANASDSDVMAWANAGESGGMAREAFQSLPAARLDAHAMRDEIAPARAADRLHLCGRRLCPSRMDRHEGAEQGEHCNGAQADMN